MRAAAVKIGALTLFCGALPLLFTDSVPQRFTAASRLKVEAATDAAINEAAGALRSKANLDNLIHALNLTNASEFAVDRPSAVRIVSDIVSGQEMTVSQAENRLRERLAQAIAVSYDRPSGQVSIAVTADEATEAVRIANMLGGTFRDEIAASGAKTSQPLVEKLRQTLDRASAALSGFVGETDEQKLAEMRRAEGEGQQRADDLQQAQAELADLKQKVQQAAAMKLEDVLSRPLPDSLEYTGLDYERQRHVEAKLALDQLTGNLGPRHPRLQAAQAAVDDIRSDIQTALKQLVSSLRQQESAAAKRLADLKAKQVKRPDDKEIVDAAARLSNLEAAVDEARRNYLEALHRAEADTGKSAPQVKVLAAATVEDAARLGPSVLEICAGGALIGFCLGGALTFLTRRKVAAEAEDAELAAEPEAIDAHWQVDLLDEADDTDERLEPQYQEPVYREPAHSEPAYVPPKDYRQEQVRNRHPAPANDTPFGDHIRDMLMANRRPAESDDLPPLVAAVLSGRVSQFPEYAAPRISEEELHKAEELRELRRNMAELRERVETYSASRSSGRR
ncbi:hypothetical protein KX729_04815 [Rhizobium sp. XQZ8]|uniref:hypothetical protein n=1 Tax=Rhizobium populisoli TaxID=2859785 RepID=UPI001CA50552|nr:hypothetical protein [Rhizobium populisoli]MBW6420757.1 hypothetical protein [Rhizobium populisoli]